ncbi:MAG TPA: AraC family transcriptional regulator, partial [Petrimonas sp.]|nr:AraC family transcriptional regulator [Petrimonas sp.]
NGDLVNLYVNAIRVAKEDKPASQQYLAGIALNILGTVLSLTQNKKFDSREQAKKIELAKIIMIEHIHENINMKELAGNIGIDYSTFRKIFKEHTGYAPLQFFHELKLRRAKELLTETSKPVKEIAYELGFGTYEYFLSFFLKKTGKSPSNYKNKR